MDGSFSFAAKEFMNQAVKLSAILGVDWSLELQKLLCKLADQVGLLNLLRSQVVSYFYRIFFFQGQVLVFCVFLVRFKFYEGIEQKIAYDVQG